MSDITIYQVTDGQLSVKGDGVDWCDYDPSMGASDDQLTRLCDAILSYHGSSKKSESLSLNFSTSLSIKSRLVIHYNIVKSRLSYQ